jgi:hypothetical protein
MRESATERFKETAGNEERKRIIKQAIEKKNGGVNLDYKFIQAQGRGVRTKKRF